MAVATYPRSAPPRVCDCGKPVSRKSISGKCLQCARRPNKQDLIGAINRFFVEHGRIPTAKEWQEKEPGRPTYNHLAYAFGSFNEAIRAAGLRPRRPGVHGGVNVQRVPSTFASDQEELEHLISEQRRDQRIGHLSFAVDPMSSRFKHKQRFYSDAWTEDVCILVDLRRQIDAWAR